MWYGRGDYDVYGMDESVVSSYLCFLNHVVHKEGRFILTFFENQLRGLMVAAYYRGA